jgi:hypothetical protein
MRGLRTSTWILLSLACTSCSVEREPELEAELSSPDGARKLKLTVYPAASILAPHYIIQLLDSRVPRARPFVVADIVGCEELRIGWISNNEIGIYGRGIYSNQLDATSVTLCDGDRRACRGKPFPLKTLDVTCEGELKYKIADGIAQPTQ